MCRADGGESPTCYRHLWRKARKPHACDECGRQIEPGEAYRYASGVYERMPYWQKTCIHCTVAQDWLSDVCGSFVHADVFEDLREHVTEYPEIGFALARVCVGMKRQWRRFDKAGLMNIPDEPPPPAYMIEQMDKVRARLAEIPAQDISDG